MGEDNLLSILLCVTGLGSHLVSDAQLSYTTHAYSYISVVCSGNLLK